MPKSAEQLAAKKNPAQLMHLPKTEHPLSLRRRGLRRHRNRRAVTWRSGEEPDAGVLERAQVAQLRKGAALGCAAGGLKANLAGRLNPHYFNRRPTRRELRRVRRGFTEYDEKSVVDVEPKLRFHALRSLVIGKLLDDARFGPPQLR